MSSVGDAVEKIRLADKLAQIDDHWNPRIVARLNGQDVRIAKVQGTFDWHHHAQEDELFLVLDGELELRFENHTLVLGPGELAVVPRGVEHQPHAESEASILLFEPSTTVNTGNVQSDRTRERLEEL